MAHGREIKRIEKEVFEKLQHVDSNKSFVKKSELGIDCKLFNLINDKFGRIDGREISDKMRILESGIYEISICDDKKLEIEFGLENLFVFFVFNISKGKKLKLIEKSSNNSLIKKSFFSIGEESEVVFSQIVKGSRYNVNLFELQKNSSLKVFEGYHIDSSKSYLNNSAKCLEEKSFVDIKMKGFAIKDSRVVCDAFVNISKEGSSCEAYQKIDGTILDSSSVIFTEPVLEVQNNNVKCSHGSSVSKIPDDIRFYLESRSLNYDEAINLFVENLDEEVLSILN